MMKKPASSGEIQPLQVPRKKVKQKDLTWAIPRGKPSKCHNDKVYQIIELFM